MSKRNILSAIALAALMSTAVLATTVSANLAPSATVANNCVIVGGSLVFGTYDSLAGTAVTGSTTFSIQCTDLMTAPNILMDQGQNDNSGTLAAPARRLTTAVSSTNYYLNYNLYSDSGYSTVWEGVTGVVSPTPDGLAHNVTVYGKIAAGQHANVPAGTYNDTVVISVVF